VGWDGGVVGGVDLDPDGCRVVHVSTVDTAAVCPSCRSVSMSVKGWVETGPRDVALPVPSRLVWRKRRWRCREPECRRSSFTESIPQVPSGARITARLRDAAGTAVALAGRTVTQAARDLGVSWPVVSAAFTERATANPASRSTPTPAHSSRSPTGGTPGSPT
jgi:transposase